MTVPFRMQDCVRKICNRVSLQNHNLHVMLTHPLLDSNSYVVLYVYFNQFLF